jgi:maleylacetate reductase
MSLAFTYEQLPARIVFGAGARRHVGAELAHLGAGRMMLIADGAATRFADDVAASLGETPALRWDEVAQHVPSELAERARHAAGAHRADAIVCVGGGSATGLAKAIALTHRIPIVAVPSTYAGSEQTTIYGVTGGRHKATGKDPIVQPRTVIYDVELTLGLPTSVTGPSAFNALAHAVEALYAPGCNPVTSALALDGVRAVHASLPKVMQRPDDVDARSELLYGAYLCGVALGATGAGLHHKLCHVLGGMFGLVHADAHSVVLPHAIAFNAPVLPGEMARLSDALGAPGGDPAGALWDLAVASQVPTSLAALHGTTGALTRDELPSAATAAAAEITANPRPFTDADLLGIYQRAFDGHRPSSA